jgi:hypothetical protein
LLGCTVAELESRISAEELGEWIEFYNLEPWGWDAACYSSGIVAATLANIHRDHKKKNKPFDPSDFIPGARERKRASGQEARERKAQLLTMQMMARARENAKRDRLRRKGRSRDGKPLAETRPTVGIKGRRQGSKGGGATDRKRGKAPSPEEN